MPRRGEKQDKRLPGNPNLPDGLHVMATRYLSDLNVKGYAATTIDTKRRHLSLFIRWGELRSIAEVHDVSRPVLERYQRYLFFHRTREGKPLSVQSQYIRLVSLRSFFKWLTRRRVILHNPAAELELPKVGSRLPKAVLTASEVEKVMGVPDIGVPIGMRDRAVLEVLYTTGMRRAELVGLDLYDIDFERETVLVRAGKGGKDRMLPASRRALAWCEAYVHQARHALCSRPEELALFVTVDGHRLTPNRLSQIVRRCIRRAEVGKTGSCHLLRHTMATLMLEGGADVRYIQEMLGHARLDTTQVYTRVSIRALKAIHEATHPGSMTSSEKLPPREDDTT